MTSPKHHVKSIVKTFDILEALERSERAGVTELSQQTGIAKSSVYKYLDTLRALGFVTKTEGQYSLSLRFFRLSNRIRDRYDVFHVARPKLETLAEKTGETVSLVVEEDGEAVYLFHTHLEDDPHSTVEVGGRLPLHVSASGKALLSYRPLEEVEALLASAEFDVDRQSLLAELEKARNQRIVIDRDATDGLEYSAGLLEGHRHTIGQRRVDERSPSVAVPIRDTEDYAIAAIEVVGSEHSLDSRRLEEDIAPLLVSAGKSIEIELLRR